MKKNYVVESSNYKDTLSISWPLPSDTYYHMRVPAIDWITNQIEYKGPGGLYDVLLRKGLASWISTEESKFSLPFSARVFLDHFFSKITDIPERNLDFRLVVVYQNWF